MTNHELIRLQNLEQQLINKINKLSDKHDEITEQLSKELSLLPPELKRLDKNGYFIPADIGDCFN